MLPLEDIGESLSAAKWLINQGEADFAFVISLQSLVVRSGHWGQMLELAHAAASSAGLLWWWIIPPGIGIAVLSLSFILIGYALDEMFNPRLRKRR